MTQGLGNNGLLFEFLLDQSSACDTHFPALLRTELQEALQTILQTCGVHFPAQVPVDAVLHCFAAAGNIGGDQRTAGGSALQQHIAHALVVTGKDDTVGRFIEWTGIWLKTEKANDPLCLEFFRTWLKVILDRKSVV